MGAGPGVHLKHELAFLQRRVVTGHAKVDPAVPATGTPFVGVGIKQSIAAPAGVVVSATATPTTAVIPVDWPRNVKAV